ncbi:TPA: winged helix-turn-helix transcriptional regulator [Bacillus cereus]|uniref:winged helix-turn-helix transcriptional regulator n=1 Tax=Bacillus cereus TaxID=1396 RepID=UPI001F274D65|nr:helix-turn-helix domain-containing protein [Bacillus cereus]BCC14560.1 MarR family transcriptional regulator [Bacillus cereus]HDR6304300.1 helix-turn-helix transcriptional regulator [Bacillus cereus]
MDTPLDSNGKLRCSIEYTLNKISNKWKTVILWHLGVDGILRYNELHKILPGVSHKVMTKQLKELEEDELIIRTQYNTVPLKVEYSLTQKGNTLMPILELMHVWGKEYGNEY